MSQQIDSEKLSVTSPGTARRIRKISDEDRSGNVAETRVRSLGERRTRGTNSRPLARAPDGGL